MKLSTIPGKVQRRVSRRLRITRDVYLRRALGLPHNHPKPQVHRQLASWTPDIQHAWRVRVLSEAFGRSVEETEAHLHRIENDTVINGNMQLWGERGIYVIEDGARRTLCGILAWLKPTIALETGVSGGAASTVILRYITEQPGGRLYSIDVKSPYDDEYGALIPDDYRPQWDFRLQDEKPLLPVLLDEIGTLDFFFHDSVHTFRHMRWEYELAWQHLRSGGILASHDVYFTSAFEDFRKAHDSEIAGGGQIATTGFWIKA